MSEVKPRRDRTLGEVYDACSARSNCSGCEYIGSLCDDDGAPFTVYDWLLEAETDAEEVPEGTEANAVRVLPNGEAPARLPICDALGVDVDEAFHLAKDDGTLIPGTFHISGDGRMKNEHGNHVPTSLVCYAINRPDRVNRVAVLSEREAAIIKAVGATWIRNGKWDGRRIELWSACPVIRGDDGEEHVNTGGYIGTLDAALFPNLKRGETLEVGSLTNKDGSK